MASQSSLHQWRCRLLDIETLHISATGKQTYILAYCFAPGMGTKFARKDAISTIQKRFCTINTLLSAIHLPSPQVYPSLIYE